MYILVVFMPLVSYLWTDEPNYSHEPTRDSKVSQVFQNCFLIGRPKGILNRLTQPKSRKLSPGLDSPSRLGAGPGWK